MFMASIIMQKIALVSVFLASAGYGREMQILDEPLKYGSLRPLKVLEELLLVSSPAAAYVGNPILAHDVGHRNAFLSPSASPALNRLLARTANYRGGRACMVAKIPDNPKVLSEVAVEALKNALNEGLFRMEMTMPDGLCLYDTQKQNVGDPDVAVPDYVKRKADRDLAYLVCEQFFALGDKVACVLPSNTLGEAEREWTEGRLATRLVSSLDKLKPKKGTGSGVGFGIREKSQLAVIVLPRADKKMLKKLQSTINDLGNDVIVVLVNPKPLRSGKNRAGYTPTFVLKDNPHPDWKGGLLFRAYPSQWVLGVAGSKGEATISEKSDERPTLDELEIGFKKIKETKGIWNRISAGFDGLYGDAAALESRVSGEDEFESDD